MQTYVIRRRSNWANATQLAVTAARSKTIGEEEMPDEVRWLRSYVVREDDGRLGTVCIYEAKDRAAIEDHARRVGMTAEDIVAVEQLVVVREDPVATT